MVGQARFGGIEFEKQCFGESSKRGEDQKDLKKYKGLINNLAGRLVAEERNSE